MYATVLRQLQLAGLLLAIPIAAFTADDTSRMPPQTAALVARLGLEEAPAPVRERPGWERPRKIVVVDIPSKYLSWFQAAAPDVELIASGTVAEAQSKVKDAEAVIGACSAGLIAEGPRLGWIQTHSAGVENCATIPALRERGILLTNMRRVYGPAIAEHVMAMMLAYARGLHVYIPEQRAGRWNPALAKHGGMLTLEGKTVLVVGLGGIGIEVARRAHAFGMRVIATRNSGRDGPDFVSYVGLPDELNRLAAEADFVVNTAPLTPSTAGMFDAKFFAAVKTGAFFVNVGRGGSVVQSELIAALESGRLRGAGLDVTDPEPLPAGSPLWKLRNVILTPHVASQSDVAEDERFAILAENLRRYVTGDRMLSVVDPARQY